MNTKKLYTLVIDYKGGTYVTQATASTKENGPCECIKNWHIEGIEEEVSEDDRSEILKSLEEENFVLLDGMINAWCGGVLLKGEYMLMNMIETCDAT